MYVSPAESLLSEIIESCDLYGNYCREHNSPAASQVDKTGRKRWNDALEEIIDFADEVRASEQRGY